MPDYVLPDGAYFSVVNSVRTHYGGMTKAMLMRNRFFATYGGVQPSILTFDAYPLYPSERERLTERGDLVAGTRLLNLYEFYRDADDTTLSAAAGTPLGAEVTGGAVDAAGGPLPTLDDHLAVDVPHPHGGVYYTAYRHWDEQVDVVRDYRRPDGSVYLRAPGPRVLKEPAPFVLLDRAGVPRLRWPTKLGWAHHWLRTLLGDRERAFVISDGRGLQSVRPLIDPRFFLLPVMHEIHLTGNRQWNGPISPGYREIVAALADFDGFVTLTRRHRQDIAQRFGPRANLFTIPNAVTIPEPPSPLPDRVPDRFAIITRLSAQKRLDEALHAFALVVARRPQARLVVYGHGPLEAWLERLAGELGLADNVDFRGWDPDAREVLWSCSGFLMTSEFEGYPLASLESMSRGCPLLAYDIKYGPQEQIDDGVDGYLVAELDRQALADRIIAMIDDPELAQRLGRAAISKAQRHDYRTFMADWQRVLSTVEANRGRRVILNSARLEVKRLGHYPTRLPLRVTSRLLPFRTGSDTPGPGRRMVLEAKLAVSGEWPPDAIQDAQLTLDAVSETTEQVVRLPLRVRRSKGGFTLRSVFLPESAFAGRSEDDGSVVLRLRLVMRNAAWETRVRRPEADRPALEIAFDGQQRVYLHRH